MANGRGSKPIEDEGLFFNSPLGHIRDRVRFHQSPDIPKEGIFVSLNGFPFQIKPDEDIDIPRPVLKMIDTRIRTDTQQGEDGKPYTRDIPRYTYTVIKLGVNLDEAGKVISSVKNEPQATQA
jgi:hypothetical protein